MLNSPIVFPAFIVLAIIFLSLAARDNFRFRAKGKDTPARKAWFRIGLIFGIVALYLYGSHIFTVGRRP
jgi:hypothetical protein